MNNLLETLERRVLPFVARPGRYVGGEIGLPVTAGPARLRLALVYPDVYEVGMSNLGLKILCSRAARIPGVAVERAFAPWPDMEERMREAGLPLYGLESFTPLAQFDLVGVTLQSELTYTNILNVLDLAGIPLLSSGRTEEHPLVCAGGPCAVNPEVLAPFFDFFVLGDGEQVLDEALGILIELKEKGAGRKERLEALGRIEGVYVPGPVAPDGEDLVSVRRVSSLDGDMPEPFPVPLIELAQHHLAVEIMRGCTCGCRFCQAGMIYRPVRVKPLDRIVETVRRGIREGGWDSVTLLSLSSADYPAIGDLVVRLLPEVRRSGVRLAFPSLRVDSGILPLLENLEEGKKSGLTFAVEAGSSRLRDVIGKKVSEEDLLRLVEDAYSRGWNLVKLYFMIGLPTETVDDIDAIADLINRVAALGRSKPGRRNVNVTVSPFVPKPGTPFQWEAQDTPESSRGKIARIRSGVRSKTVKVKYHEPESSVLEGVLARGDRRLARVLHTAWEMGARFDGWREYFDWPRWQAAFASHGLEICDFLAAREPGGRLPWSFIRTPVSGHFLAEQLDQARRAVNVADCRDEACLLCGADKPAICRSLRSLDKTAVAKLDDGMPGIAVATPDTDCREWRLRYAKRGLLRYTGHLDTVRNIEYLIRRSGVPVLYSGGFTPRMRLSFSPPLPLGVESSAEYFDLETLPLSENELSVALNRAVSVFNGFELLEIKALPRGLVPPLAQDIVGASWNALLENGPPPPLGGAWTEYIESRRRTLLDAGGEHDFTDRRGRPRRIRLAETLRDLSCARRENGAVVVEFSLELQGDNACRADIFLEFLLGIDSREAAAWRIEKTAALCRAGSRAHPNDF